MDDPPSGQAFTKRLWPKGIEIPNGWTLSEELTRLVELTHPGYVLIVGWFDPTWRESEDYPSG